MTIVGEKYTVLFSTKSVLREELTSLHLRLKQKIKFQPPKNIINIFAGLEEDSQYRNFMKLIQRQYYEKTELQLTS